MFLQKDTIPSWYIVVAFSFLFAGCGRDLAFYSASSLSNTNVAPLLARASLWLDSDDTSTLYGNSDCSTAPVLVAGAGIGCWKDKSQNHIDFTQDTNSRRPSYIGNLGGIQFTGASQTQLVNHTTPLLNAGGAATVFAVVQIPNGSAENQILDMGAEGGMRRTLGMDFTGKLYFSQNSDQFYFYSALAPSGNIKRITVTEMGDAGSISFTGVGETSGVLSTASTASGLPTTIGGRYTLDKFFLDSTVQEFLVFREVLPATDKQAIENYLEKKYHLQ